MHNRAPSISQLVGDTPLVHVPSLGSDSVEVYAKLEGNNPAGSVKDRAAKSMIIGLLERGDVTDGQTVVEATSGNTGIALAMIAAQHGVELELIMPSTATIERVKTMRAYGATVTLVDNGIEGARDLMAARAESDRYVALNQFNNPDNPAAHYRTTGPEIWNATDGTITHFVSAMGTTGTIMGVSRFLKERSDTVEIVGVQPTEGSNIPGIRRWSAEYLPGNFDPAFVDQTLDVSRENAIKMSRYLAATEGIFAGMSSGGAAHVAQRVAATLDSGVVVFISCDRGDRYLSSDLYV